MLHQIGSVHRRSLRIAVLLIALMMVLIGVGPWHAQAMPHGTQAAAGTGAFVISGSTMRDPNGNEFIPYGANVNGYRWVWGGDVTAPTMVDKVVNGWKFNFLRVNNTTGCHDVTSDPRFNTDIAFLKKIVDTYTPYKIVVMFEVHDLPANATELECTANWWKQRALDFKNNPYVWFNLLNEPGGLRTENSPNWVSDHQRLIRAVRDDAAAANIIVLDGISAGQDQIRDWGACDYVQNSYSAILTWGQQMTAYRANVGFSVHTYGAGGCTDENQNRLILADYIDKIHAKNLWLMVGETGSTGDNWNTSWGRAVRATYAVAPGKRVGAVAWHGQPGDGFCLYWDGSSCGIDRLASNTNPPRQPAAGTGTGLTPHGQLHWDTYRNGSPTQPTATPAAATPTPAAATATPAPVPTATPPANQPLISAGTYKITAVHSGKVLDVNGVSQADGAIVQQWQYVGGLNQQWQVEPLADGTYHLTAKHSGKRLDAKNAGTADGTPIQQWSANDTCAQKWRIERAGTNTYTVRSTCSSKVLDVNGVSQNNGAPIQLWTGYGGTNQQWRFEAP